MQAIKQNQVSCELALTDKLRNKPERLWSTCSMGGRSSTVHWLWPKKKFTFRVG